MSRRAAALGVVDYLSSLPASHWTGPGRVTHQPDGSPPATAGQTHLTVRTTGVRSQSAPSGARDRMYSVEITLHQKLAILPPDRRGAGVDAQTDGLLEVAEGLAAGLVGDYAVTTSCSRQIEGFGQTTNGFLEPFAESSDAGVIPGQSGTVSVSVTLSGLRRVWRV